MPRKIRKVRAAVKLALFNCRASNAGNAVTGDFRSKVFQPKTAYARRDKHRGRSFERCGDVAARIAA